MLFLPGAQFASIRDIMALNSQLFTKLSNSLQHFS